MPGCGGPWVWERYETGGGEPTAAGSDLCRNHHRRVQQSPAEVPHGSPDVILILLHHRLAWPVSDRLVWEQPVPAQDSGDEVNTSSSGQAGQSQSCCGAARVSVTLHVHYIQNYIYSGLSKWIFKVYYGDIFTEYCPDALSAFMLFIGWQEGHPACENWVVGCWRG